jgi:hypothetical protein
VGSADPISGVWMPYVGVLNDYAAELANFINDLTLDVEWLRACACVTALLTDKQTLAVLHELIDRLGTVALGRIYAIKSSFAFAAGHFCHQANISQDMANCRDEFPNAIKPAAQ